MIDKPVFAVLCSSGYAGFPAGAAAFPAAAFAAGSFWALPPTIPAGDATFPAGNATFPAGDATFPADAVPAAGFLIGIGSGWVDETLCSLEGAGTTGLLGFSIPFTGFAVDNGALETISILFPSTTVLNVTDFFGGLGFDSEAAVGGKLFWLLEGGRTSAVDVGVFCLAALAASPAARTGTNVPREAASADCGGGLFWLLEGGWTFAVDAVIFFLAALAAFPAATTDETLRPSNFLSVGSCKEVTSQEGTSYTNTPIRTTFGTREDT